jgi:hypothetical protein
MEYKAWECCSDVPAQDMKADVKECQRYIKQKRVMMFQYQVDNSK